MQHLKIKGFSLLECFLICTIISSLLIMSISIGNTIQERMSVTHAAQQLAHIIQYTRNLAIITHNTLTLAPKTKHASWHGPLLIFNDTPTHQAPKNILYSQSLTLNKLKLTWHGFQSNAYIIFANTLAHAASNGYFLLTTANGKNYKIVLNRLANIVQSSYE